ncbi:hypothetical protein EK904_008542 [Melospiza melodia maxima]|nr:hypothetical protein EK904_008542 [Melospiza melodia maxima]
MGETPLLAFLTSSLKALPHLEVWSVQCPKPKLVRIVATKKIKISPKEASNEFGTKRSRSLPSRSSLNQRNL